MKNTYVPAGRARRIPAVVSMAIAFLFHLFSVIEIVITGLFKSYGAQHIIANLFSVVIRLGWVSVAVLFVVYFLAPRLKWLGMTSFGAMLLVTLLGMLFSLIRLLSFNYGIESFLLGVLNLGWFNLLTVAALVVGFLFAGKNIWILRIVSVFYLLSGVWTQIMSAIALFERLSSSDSLLEYLGGFNALTESSSEFALFFPLAIVLFAWIGFRKEAICTVDSKAVESESLRAESAVEE